MIRVVEYRIERVAEVVKNLNFVVSNFSDGEIFPPAHVEEEQVLRYFFFVTALDHRTAKSGKFEGLVNGKYLHGSDLLHKLSLLKFYENPDFFSPRHMSEIAVEEVKAWLSVSEPKPATVWDPEVRAFLLRDAGGKLLKLYDGRVSNMVEEASGRLCGVPGGFIDILKVFRAYEDPVSKKSFLLAKFLLRRGLLKVIDLENMEVPVDNHVTRVAVRLGIVEPLGENPFASQREVSWEEDVIIRLQVRRAFKLVSKLSNMDPGLLDDLLWSLGRKICLRPRPLCDEGVEVLGIRKCPFRSVCAAYEREERRTWLEHNYTNTWYY